MSGIIKTNNLIIGNDNNLNNKNNILLSGEGNIINNNYQIILGKYSDNSNTNNIFIIGNGIDNNNRNNALLLNNQGNLTVNNLSYFNDYKNNRLLIIDNYFDGNDTTPLINLNNYYLCISTTSPYTQNYIYKLTSLTPPLSTEEIIPEDFLIIYVNYNKKYLIYYNNNWMCINEGRTNIENIKNNSIIFNDYTNNINNGQCCSVFGYNNKIIRPDIYCNLLTGENTHIDVYCSKNIIGGSSHNISSTIENSLIVGMNNKINVGDTISQNNIILGSINKVDMASNSIIGGNNNVLDSCQNNIICGNYNNIIHDNCIVSGIYNNSSRNNQFITGQYNDNTDTNNLFVVGNGTNDNNRSNAFIVKNDEVKINTNQNRNENYNICWLNLSPNCKMFCIVGELIVVQNLDYVVAGGNYYNLNAVCYGYQISDYNMTVFTNIKTFSSLNLPNSIWTCLYSFAYYDKNNKLTYFDFSQNRDIGKIYNNEFMYNDLCGKWYGLKRDTSPVYHASERWYVDGIIVYQYNNSKGLSFVNPAYYLYNQTGATWNWGPTNINMIISIENFVCFQQTFQEI